MRGAPWGRAAAAAVLALLLVLAARAEGLKVSSSVNKSRLRLGESLTFTLRVEGTDLLPQPALPPLEGFRVAGTYQTVEALPGGGRALLFHYLLNPAEAGRLRVPPFSLRVGGEAVEVPGFTVEVETGGAPPPATAPEPATAAPAAVGDDLLLQGSLSASRVFVGQPVVYTLHLLTRRSVRGIDITRSASFEGFQKVEEPGASRARAVQVRRGGKLYLDAVVLRATLFPIEPGARTVEDFEADLRLEGAGGRLNLRGGSARLEVLPLPSPPAGFRGAVGRFTLRVAEPPPARVEGGRPVSLGLEVEGEGFLPDGALEVSATPLLQAYPPEVADHSGFSGGLLRVRRSFRLSFLPRTAGPVEIPEARLTVFDPESRTYKTLAAGGGRVLVGAGAPGTGAEVSLAPLVERPLPGRGQGPLLSRALFWRLLPLPYLALLLFAAGLGFYRTFLTAPEKRRARLLRNRARRNLLRARRRLDVRRAEECHEALSRALTDALDLRAGRATSGLDRERLLEVLRESGLEEEAARRAVGLVERLERARYAPERPTKMELAALYEEVRSWVQGTPGASSPRRVLLPVLALLALFGGDLPRAGGTGDLLARRAAEAYHRGDYAEARRIYLLLREAEGDGAALHFDLGNCALKAGDLGRAILEYRRALRLDPRFQPARTNLEAARRLLPARVPPYAVPPWEAFLASLPEGLPEAAVLVLSLLACLSAALVLLLPPGEARRFWARFLAASVLLGLLSALLMAGSDAVLPRRRPVVVVAPAEVTAAPESGGKVLAILPPGSEILRVAEAGSRSLVLWGEGRGWTDSSAVEEP